MPWFSILPAHLSVLETWIIRIFVRSHYHASFMIWENMETGLMPCQILLGTLTIGPWALLIAYDLILYILRAVTYEIPYVGGRARGRQPPRAPSLAERPIGRPRTFSIGGPLSSSGEPIGKEGLRERLGSSPSRNNDNIAIQES